MEMTCSILIVVGSFESIGRDLDVEWVLLGVAWKFLMIIRLLIVLYIQPHIVNCPVLLPTTVHHSAAVRTLEVLRKTRKAERISVS